ncbi:acylphosphatase [Arthrobacter woluwensis]|uniref:acylphosphatase n=1 Tax=Arthrobacter woluwensis TaxID=156980 RepID=A0A1H4JM78_9MICC|nr:acylphosphatase [Arthrobacter woluwensis]SEB47065.1 acylphosphatase [Arthrobacter woluwensis]
MERIRLLITGRVQAVGYRFAMCQAAEEIGVSGWVRNRADGSVEAEAEGDPKRLADLVAWAHHGPRWARVDAVRSEPVPPTGGSGFDVLPDA